ncbi:hypothetical protein DFH29DRAFT_881176 [Suillus ampliporus]|nr:hypothetical protein DFH29DRAFT_881176 [Suillus ampliporus]
MLSIQLHWSSDLQLEHQGKDVSQSSQLKKFMRGSFIGQKREDTIAKGFSQLSFATLYSLFKSKLAGRKAARQRLVTMAWELEESEWFTTFLDGVHHENKDRLLFSDEELKQIRNIFCEWTQEQINDDTNYLQAVYDDDCEILCTVAAQAKVLSKHLGLRVKEDVLGSMGVSSHSPQFVDDSMDDDKGAGDDDEEANEEDNAIDGCFLCKTNLNQVMPGGCGSQHKGKSAILKPARGSGLNPSGLPIADQLRLATELPRMSLFNFNLYGETGRWQAQDEWQQSPDNAQGSSSHYHVPIQEQPSYGDGQDPSLCTDKPEQDFYDHFHDALLDPSLSFNNFQNQQEFSAPVPRWIEDAHDGGASLIDRGDGLTGSPARTTTTCTVQWTTMPATPYSTSQTPTITTEGQTHSIIARAQEMLSGTEALLPPQNIISLTPETTAQVIQMAKIMVAQIIFSKYAMAYSRRQRKRLIDKVIKDSIPNEFGPDVVFRGFITNVHCKQVRNALSTKRGKITDFAREGACDTFQLFPPINRFTLGADPLTFMHDVYFDENDVIIIHAKFQNRFIMANVICFIWYWGLASFLGTSPLTSIKHIVAVAGAATHCTLHEQGKGHLELDLFGGEVHHRKFKDITGAFDSLTPAEKDEFEKYLHEYTMRSLDEREGTGEQRRRPVSGFVAEQEA